MPGKLLSVNPSSWLICKVVRWPVVRRPPAISFYQCGMLSWLAICIITAYVFHANIQLLICKYFRCPAGARLGSGLYCLLQMMPMSFFFNFVTPRFAAVIESVSLRLRSRKGCMSKGIECDVIYANFLNGCDYDTVKETGPEQWYVSCSINSSKQHESHRVGTKGKDLPC